MEVKRALDEGGVCWGPYQSISDLVSNDPDCSTENPLFSLVDQPGIGEYLVPSQPIYFTGLDSEPASPAPLLGQHTDEILSEILCLGSTEIGKLHDAKIIAVTELHTWV